MEIEGKKWRKPNEEELAKVFDYLSSSLGGNLSELEGSAIVLENYVSDRDGYIGKLLFIVFEFPNPIYLFKFSENRIEEVERVK